MKDFKNFVIISVPVLIVCLIIMEVVLRKWFYVDDPYEKFKNRYDKSYIPARMPPNAKYTFRSNEGLPGMDSVVTYTTNNVGFRGEYLSMPKPDNEFRIFLIGGSTAQCLHLDDSKSLDRVIQNELREQFTDKKIKVYNAGRSGEATPEHIAILAQKIIHLDPDLVILFSGFNDFRRSVRNYDFKHLTQSKLYSPRYIYLAATDLQIFRRLYYMFGIRTFEEIRETLPFETNYRRLFKMQQEAPVSDSVPKTDAAPYATNLASIAGICRNNHVQILFITNQSTWNSSDVRSKQSHYMLTCDKIRYKEEYMANGLQVFNDTMCNMARRMNIPLFDLSRDIPKTQDYFYDDCHFNTDGALFTGKKLARLIQDSVILHGLDNSRCP